MPDPTNIRTRLDPGQRALLARATEAEENAKFLRDCLRALYAVVVGNCAPPPFIVAHLERRQAIETLIERGR